MFTITTAAKEKVKLMIGLTGPSGSGKTFSALKLAHGITGDWKRIAVADTENRSALYYAGDKTGPWTHIDFPPTLQGGYHPNNWISLIKTVEGMKDIDVLILDSITHEWKGIGGALRLSEAYAKERGANSFTAWSKVTPLHDAFIDKMRHSRLHIIATMRVQTDFSMEKNESTGKTIPKKVGLKPTQREDTDYEFGVILDVDINHLASSSKDRTGLFADRAPFLITADVGKELVQWTKEGADPAVEPVKSQSAIAPPESVLKAIEQFKQFDIWTEHLEAYFDKRYDQWDMEILEDIRAIWKDCNAKKENIDKFLYAVQKKNL